MEAREFGYLFPISLFSPLYALIILGASMRLSESLWDLLSSAPDAVGIFWRFPARKSAICIRLSQKVTLGDINSIQEDPNLAMRIRITPGRAAQLPGSLYWRGIAFDHYDGLSWSTTVPGTRFLFRDSVVLLYVRDSGRWTL